jgi:hypothetical protein
MIAVVATTGLIGDAAARSSDANDYARHGIALEPPEVVDGAVGAMAPLAPTGVQLVTERVHARFDEYGPSWRVDAEYVLRNPGTQVATLEVGVPMRWQASFFTRETPPQPSSEAANAVRAGIRAIAFEVAGKRLGCNVRFLRTRAERTEGTCVARLDVPPGDSQVTVTFPGATWFERVGDAFVERLEFDPAPAAFWTGPVRSFSMEIDLGKFVRTTGKFISPPVARLDGARLIWAYEEFDPRRLGPILIEFGKGEERWPGARWVRRELSLSAAATSTLAAQGAFTYDPSRAVDSDRGTGWCEGVAGDGIGESLSVSFTMPEPSSGEECRLLDLELVAGLARSERVYTANGRVTRARFENCSDPKDGFEAELTAGANAGVRHGIGDPDRFDDDPVEIAIPVGSLSSAKCVRLVIKGVRRGSKYSDTCVSEFTPRVYCRTPLPKATAPSSAPELSRPRSDGSAASNPAVEACPSRIQERISEAMTGVSGSWSRLVKACQECSQPFRNRDQPWWHPCEFALKIERADAAKRTTRDARPSDKPLRDCLKYALQTAASVDEMSLLCTGTGGKELRVDFADRHPD